MCVFVLLLQQSLLQHSRPLIDDSSVSLAILSLSNSYVLCNSLFVMLRCTLNFSSVDLLVFVIDNKNQYKCNISRAPAGFLSERRTVSLLRNRKGGALKWPCVYLSAGTVLVVQLP